MAALPRLCRQAWEPVLARARGAVVFLDAAAAEALHWGGGGAGELLAAGALAVKPLPPSEGAAAAAAAAASPRAVFVLSGPLRGWAAAAVRAVLETGSVRCCALLCAGEAEGGEPEESLRRWMGPGGRAEAVLRGAPLLVPLTAELGLLPASAGIVPPAGGPRQGGPGEPGLGALPGELRAAVRVLVGELDALLGAMGLREECFALGSLSRVLAAELASCAPARNRRRMATHRAAVVFVDRTLDLAGKEAERCTPSSPHQKASVWVARVLLSCVHRHRWSHAHRCPTAGCGNQERSRRLCRFSSGPSALLQIRDLSEVCVVLQCEGNAPLGLACALWIAARHVPTYRTCHPQHCTCPSRYTPTHTLTYTCVPQTVHIYIHTYITGCCALYFLSDAMAHSRHPTWKTFQ